MPVVRDPGDLPARQGAGWAEQAWAGPQELGAPVPDAGLALVAGPGAVSPPIGLGAPEGLLYVMAGSGTAETGGARFTVGPENLLWLGGCPELTLRAGARGLEALIAQAPARGHAAPRGRGRPSCLPRRICRTWSPPGTPGTGWIWLPTRCRWGPGRSAPTG